MTTGYKIIWHVTYQVFLQPRFNMFFSFLFVLEYKLLISHNICFQLCNKANSVSWQIIYSTIITFKFICLTITFKFIYLTTITFKFIYFLRVLREIKPFVQAVIGTLCIRLDRLESLKFRSANSSALFVIQQDRVDRAVTSTRWRDFIAVAKINNHYRGDYRALFQRAIERDERGEREREEG